MILDRGIFTQGDIAVAEAVYFDAVLFPDVLNELCYFIDLDGHVIVDVDDHSQRLRSFVLYFLELLQEMGRFLLIEGRVDHEQRNHRLRPKLRQHFSEQYIYIENKKRNQIVIELALPLNLFQRWWSNIVS